MADIDDVELGADIDGAMAEVDKASEEIAKNQTTRRMMEAMAAAPKPAQRTDLEAFVHTGNTLLAMQREKLSQEESAYQLERTRISDIYRIQREQLDHDALEALRQHDLAYETRRIALKKMINLLLIVQETADSL